MIEEHPSAAPAGLFFISLEGDGDPVLVSSASSGTASVDPSGTRSRLGSSPLSSSLPKRLHIEERLARRSQRASLSSSPGEVHLRRTHHLHELQARLAQADRRKRETVAQVKRQQEREQRSAWARMRERDFVVQYRRERLKHVPRSRLLEADLKTDHLSTMAGLIGGTWLRGKVRPLVEAFLATGILDISEGLQGGGDRRGTKLEEDAHEDHSSSNPLIRTNQDPEIGYARMQEAMMDRTTIVRATDLMVRLVRCDPVAAHLMRPAKAGRILLTALLLDGFGAQVMPEASAQEEILLEHAGLLAEALRAYLKHPVRTTQMSLAEHWCVFCESFTSWQGVSQAALVHSLQADYIELAHLLATLQSEEAKAEWRPHVLRHQRRLRAALMRVAGQGAIRGLEERLADLKISPGEGGEQGEDGSNQAIKRGDIKFQEAPSASEEDKQQVGEALGINWDDGKLSNIRIAHELIIDPYFDHAKLMTMQRTAMAMARGGRGSQSGLRSREAALRIIPTPTTTEDFLRFVLLIKEQLLEMIHGQGSLAQLLESHMEETFLKQQLANGALPMRSLLLLLVDCMGKMCAPARDAQIKHLMEQLGGERGASDADRMDTDAVVRICQEMVRTILLMHEDLSNFALRTVRPRLAQLIVGYEREWLAQHVLLKGTSMPVAENLIRALAAMGQEDSVGDGRLDNPHPSAPPLQRTHWIIRESLVTLLGFPTSGLPSEVVPSIPAQHELFTLDHQRLGVLRRRLLLLVQLSAIGLSLRSLGHPQWEGSLERMMLLSLPDGREKESMEPGQGHEQGPESDRSIDHQQQIVNPRLPDGALEEATRGITREGERQAIRAAIHRISSSSCSASHHGEGGSGGDPLELLLRRRIGALLRQVLQSDGESTWESIQGNKVGSGKPVSILMRHGIAECLCGPLNEALVEAQRVYHLHRMVLAPVYYKYLHQ